MRYFVAENKCLYVSSHKEGDVAAFARAQEKSVKLPYKPGRGRIHLTLYCFVKDSKQPGFNRARARLRSRRLGAFGRFGKIDSSWGSGRQLEHPTKRALLLRFDTEGKRSPAVQFSILVYGKCPILRCTNRFF